jgi:protein-S-isoprenylcysteine O-methyltransferase Ste14
MVTIGNFLFHYRNGLFPLAYLLLFVQGKPVFAQDWLAAALGFAVAMSGQIIRVVTIGLAYIIRGGRNRQVYAEDLVTDGLFSHCRNPLYVGNYLVLVGLGLAANGWVFVLIGFPGFYFAYRAIIAAEENFLRNKFGAGYDAYCSRVNRLVPRLSGIGDTVRGMEFRWQRVIVKEYGSTYAWMMGMALVVMKNRWLREGYARAQTEIFALTGVAALLTLGYVIVRQLKRSGRLKGD